MLLLSFSRPFRLSLIRKLHQYQSVQLAHILETYNFHSALDSSPLSKRIQSFCLYPSVLCWIRSLHMHMHMALTSVLDSLRNSLIHHLHLLMFLLVYIQVIDV